MREYGYQLVGDVSPVFPLSSATETSTRPVIKLADNSPQVADDVLIFFKLYINGVAQDASHYSALLRGVDIVRSLEAWSGCKHLLLKYLVCTIGVFFSDGDSLLNIGTRTVTLSSPSILLEICCFVCMHVHTSYAHARNFLHTFSHRKRSAQR